MAVGINLRPGTSEHSGARRGNTKQRVFLAILLISGIVGAGAVVELLTGSLLRHSE